MPIDSTTGILMAPVGIGDVQQAIGLSSGDLGTLITQGAQGGLINRWAIYKPYRANVSPELPVDYEPETGGWMVSGLKVPWGDDIGYVGSGGVPSGGFITELANDVTWDYLYPRGLNHSEIPTPSYDPSLGDYVEPFRLGDFLGYQTAKGSYDNGCPWPYVPTMTELIANSTGSFTLGANLPTVITGNLTLGAVPVPDIIAVSPVRGQTLEHFYLGVLLYRKTAGTLGTLKEAYWKTAAYRLDETSTTDIAQKRLHVSFTGLSGALGVWNVRTFLSSQQLALNEEPVQGTGLYVACGSATQLTLIDPDAADTLGISLSAKVLDTANTQVRVSATIVNYYSVNVNITAVRLTLETRNTLTANPTTWNRTGLEPGDDVSGTYLFTGASYADLPAATITMRVTYVVNGQTLTTTKTVEYNREL